MLFKNCTVIFVISIAQPLPYNNIHRLRIEMSVEMQHVVHVHSQLRCEWGEQRKAVQWGKRSCCLQTHTVRRCAWAASSPCSAETRSPGGSRMESCRPAKCLTCRRVKKRERVTLKRYMHVLTRYNTMKWRAAKSLACLYIYIYHFAGF